MTRKLCNTCKLEKNLIEFHKNRHKLDGRREICKQCVKEYDANHYPDVKEKRCNQIEIWQLLNKDRDLDNKQKWRDDNKKWFKEYFAKNRDKINDYQKKKYKRDVSYRLRNSISDRMRASLKSGKNGNSWESLVGYTLKDLLNHLEERFQPGMNWTNYGSVWEIDHLIPVSHFEYFSYNDEEFKMCWNLYNLRPLWKSQNRKENHRKVNKDEKEKLRR